ENEIEFEKIHDLGFLLEKCKEILPEILFLKEDLLLLSAYAVEIRYPGIEADKEDAEKCIVTLEKIRKIIRKYFGLA
ncbi:MAG: HEPN domain-containing protein, partial [Thermoanaerobaculia bacterium]